jgi:hypothetical protein
MNVELYFCVYKIINKANLLKVTPVTLLLKNQSEICSPLQNFKLDTPYPQYQ